MCLDADARLMNHIAEASGKAGGQQLVETVRCSNVAIQGILRALGFRRQEYLEAKSGETALSVPSHYWMGLSLRQQRSRYENLFKAARLETLRLRELPAPSFS